MQRIHVILRLDPHPLWLLGFMIIVTQEKEKGVFLTNWENPCSMLQTNEGINGKFPTCFFYRLNF